MPLDAPTAKARWYYVHRQQQMGPVSGARLKQLAATGELAPTDMVLREGTKKWVAAADVKGLFPSLRGDPGRPPAPSPLPADLPGQPHGTIFQAQARRWPHELIASLVVMVLITVAYVIAAKRGVPRPGSLLGHTLGVVGFLLMLSTETLYSLRKRVPGFAWGRMTTWLQVHIFTGFVGAYLVLLHSAGKFNGLAGVLMLLTVLMVLSGIVGRYIYTAVPRTLDGVEVAVRELEDEIAVTDRRLQALRIHLPASVLQSVTDVPRSSWILVLGRGWLRWRYRRRLHRAMRDLSEADRAHAGELEQLLAERFRLQMQIGSLAATRRLLALWHVVHIPLGVALFTLAFLHIGGALYYATLLK